jgi:hypothetical protein
MAVISFSHAIQVHKVLFPGIAEVDSLAADEAIIRPQGTGTFHVTAMEISRTSGIKPGVTGTTTVTAALSSLGSGMDASITQAQRKSAAAVTANPGLEFTAGSPIYIRRSAAGGGHSDIEVTIYVKMA